ncbi:hypothetical protein [Salsuginibacillus kocurii]|uniref:hypothetical protein n=1 Tax=Salsuginibacillus kocurii TaxID=427078 RepID=UPI00037F08FE|nr:hypothetical protein [Salsuginibacillus kocurii]
MAVTKEEVRGLIDHLSEEQVESVYEYIQEIRKTGEQELSEGQVKGLYDDEAYLEEGELNPFDDVKSKSVDRDDRI